MTLPSLTLILGAAASGKSAFAEKLVESQAENRLYIATAEAQDGEMAEKIAAHRARRGAGWRTEEAPLDPAPALATAKAREVVLLDCATLWLANHIMAGNDPAAASEALESALAACPAPVVIVSNETGMGIVPESPLARRFRAAQGALNQRLAARAGLAVMVIAGLPLVLKGALPEAAS